MLSTLWEIWDCSVVKVHTALTVTSGENKNALPGRVGNSTSSATSFANRLRRSYAVNFFSLMFSLAVRLVYMILQIPIKVKFFAVSGISRIVGVTMMCNK